MKLTPALVRVLELAADGLETKEIAAALHVSPRTIDAQRVAILDRLGANNMVNAYKLALQSGQIGINTD